MATVALIKRVIRVPFANIAAPVSGPAFHVVQSIMTTLQGLAYPNTSIVVLNCVDPAGLGLDHVWNVEAVLTSAADATFVSNMPGWATALGVTMLDTCAYTVTYGY